LQLESLLRRRAMIRAFRRDAIEDDKVWRILRNAWRAPSAGHLEPQDFVVVRDEGVKKSLAEAALGQAFVGKAPVVIVVCSDTRRNVGRYGERGRDFYSIIDGSFASFIILLSAVELGLGACFVGAFDDERVSKVLGLPKEVRPIGIIPLGKPAEIPRRLNRQPLERRVHYNSYGNSLSRAVKR